MTSKPLHKTGQDYSLVSRTSCMAYCMKTSELLFMPVDRMAKSQLPLGMNDGHPNPTYGMAWRVVAGQNHARKYATNSTGEMMTGLWPGFIY